MNKYLTYIAILCLSCQTNSEKAESAETLLAIDAEFSKMSAEQGMSEAFIFYADQDVVKLGQGAHPIVGKTRLSEVYSAIDDAQIALTWEPAKAEMAQSADLGYTYGKYYYTVKDSVETTTIGYYISVWKKQADGTWKYVIDGGAEGPIE